MTSHTAAGAVLLLIDLQRAIDHPDWGERNNPQADANLIKLLGLWRSSDIGSVYLLTGKRGGTPRLLPRKIAQPI